MTDLSGITITTGILPASTKENLVQAVERVGAKIVDGVRIDTTHFVTTEGRGQAWEKAVEQNIPVVRPEWVAACEKNGRILGVTKFYLDAMRPGPPEEQTTTPVVPQAQPAAAPAAPPANTEGEASNGKDEEQKPEVPKKSGDEEDDEDDEDDDRDNEPEQKAIAESEPKARAPEEEEQKVRLEDKEEHQVALRQKQEGDTAKNGAEEDEEDEEDDEDKGDQAGKKPATTPDGASFQEISL